MADKTDRGTHNDPAWEAKNLSGGTDSSAASIDRDRLDLPDGPDLTSRLLEETSAVDFGLPEAEVESARAAHEERNWPGAQSQVHTVGDEVTDESGRIAPADFASQTGHAGGARDSRVTGEERENVTED